MENVPIARNTLLALIYASVRYYQNIGNHLEVMERTAIRLRNSFKGDN